MCWKILGLINKRLKAKFWCWSFDQISVNLLSMFWVCHLSVTLFFFWCITYVCSGVYHKKSRIFIYDFNVKKKEFWGKFLSSYEHIEFFVQLLLWIQHFSSLILMPSSCVEFIKRDKDFILSVYQHRLTSIISLYFLLHFLVKCSNSSFFSFTI